MSNARTLNVAPYCAVHPAQRVLDIYTAQVTGALPHPQARVHLGGDPAWAKPRVMRLDAMLRTLAKGAGKIGFRLVSPTAFEWDQAGRCQRPVGRDYVAHRDRKSERWLKWAPGDAPAMQLLLWTRCRRCARCLRMRSNEWTEKALAEVRAAARTWFGTLTCSAENNQRMLNELRSYASRANGEDFDALEEDERFRRMVEWHGVELQKAFKRLRFNSKVPFRYIAVPERHESGFPHWHVLMHESDLHRPFVKNEHLRDDKFWHLGFTRWNLCRDNDSGKRVRYACKYLSKEAAGRVRASLHYGQAVRLAMDVLKDIAADPGGC